MLGSSSCRPHHFDEVMHYYFSPFRIMFVFRIRPADPPPLYLGIKIEGALEICGISALAPPPPPTCMEFYFHTQIIDLHMEPSEHEACQSLNLYKVRPCNCI
jgi:hypothetical protein